MLLSKTPKAAPFHACMYSVKGTNPATGKRKTVKILAGSSDKEKEIVKKSGLLPPFEISAGEREPTSSQLDLAKKWKVKVPKEAILEDVSLLLGRRDPSEAYSFDTDEEWEVFDQEMKGPLNKKPASKKVFQFAIENGFYLSKYATMFEAKYLLLSAFPNKKNEIIKLTGK